MTELFANEALRNHVYAARKQHHLDDNFEMEVFGKKKLNEKLTSKIKSSLKKDGNSSFFTGKNFFVMMYKKADSTDNTSPNEVMTKFINLIKDGMLGDPKFTKKDLEIEKAVLKVNVGDEDNPKYYYFAAFKMGL